MFDNRSSPHLAEPRREYRKPVSRRCGHAFPRLDDLFSQLWSSLVDVYVGSHGTRAPHPPTMRIELTFMSSQCKSAETETHSQQVSVTGLSTSSSRKFLPKLWRNLRGNIILFLSLSVSSPPSPPLCFRDIS